LNARIACRTPSAGWPRSRDPAATENTGTPARANQKWSDR
jgi:hypothetical protein